MNQLDIFFNTTHQKGDELKASKFKAGQQNAEILALFTLYHYRSFTPAEIWNHFQNEGRHWPLTSIRRSISTLTNEGYLVITPEMRMGNFGVKTSTWRLK